jgi:ribose 5-phosphate isomerase B
MMKIFLGSDHAGYKLKEQLKEFLDSKKIAYEDCGCYTEEPTDYPDYAFIVGRHVVEHAGSLGILACGTGAGMSIAANKVPGVRAVEAYDSYSAKMSKKDNNANVLCLRSRENTFAKVKNVVNEWLKTEFSGDVRHRKRIQKINAYETR